MNRLEESFQLGQRRSFDDSMRVPGRLPRLGLVGLRHHHSLAAAQGTVVEGREEFGARLFEGESIGNRPARGRNRPRDLFDRLFEVRIVACEAKRALIKLQRLGQVTASMMNFCEAADSGKVLRGALEHVVELGFGGFEVV